MFTPHQFIDTFQNTKRLATNTFIKDPTLNKAANDFIDAQTAFAKVLVNNTIEMTKYTVGHVSSVLFAKKAETA